MTTTLRWRRIAIAALCAAATVSAQTSDSVTDHWVTTWTTAQQLVAPPGPPPAARRSGPEASGLPATFADQTVRMVAHVSLGGNPVRVKLSNMQGAEPLEVGAAHLAVHRGNGAIADGTDRALTFGGESSFLFRRASSR